MLLLAAARGTTITISADGADEQRCRRRARRPWSQSRIRRGRMQRLSGIGVSPGVVVGPRGHPDPARTGAALPDRARRGSSTSSARLEREPRALARSSCVEIRARVARRRGPELASLFDAQLLMLDDPMLVPRAAEIVREQRVNAEWAVQQVFDEFSAVFDEVADPYLRERKGDVADLVGRLQMNLRQGVATPARSAARARRSVGADRRRADAVARGAGRLDEGPRLRHRRRQPDVSHGDSRAFARRAGGRRPAQCQRSHPARAARDHRRRPRTK